MDSTTDRFCQIGRWDASGSGVDSTIPSAAFQCCRDAYRSQATCVWVWISAAQIAWV